LQFADCEDERFAIDRDERGKWQPLFFIKLRHPNLAFVRAQHENFGFAVAVPIRDYARTVVATLAVAGPAYRFQAERIEKELAPMVSKAGREISSRLGFDVGRRDT